MTREDSDVIAKIATGPWAREYTPELGIAFHMALKDYELSDASEAVEVLVKQADRQFPPTPGEIVGLINTTQRAATAARSIFVAPTHEEVPLDTKVRQIAELHEKYPELFSSKNTEDK